MGTGALLGIIFCIDCNFVDNFLANHAAISSSRLAALCSYFWPYSCIRVGLLRSMVHTEHSYCMQSLSTSASKVDGRRLDKGWDPFPLTTP